jgi:very-short-patch-repair endonuclease
MNAVEIEEAVSRLAAATFDPEGFPFAFLEAFGNKQTTLKMLKSGSSNQSDVGGVLQRNHIHLKVCAEGMVSATLTALRESPATARRKAKFILATDGKSFEAENLLDGETVACDYPDFHDHFGFFLALAGITTVKQIRENAFDIKATGRLNRLYVELLKENPDWDSADRREEMNHFMARLIFCFFAEDTNIFHSEGLFTNTIAQMSDASNTHEVLSEVFRAMCTPLKERVGIRNWADVFPYVNGGLFSPHPLTPSPALGEGEQEAVSPLSQRGRGVGGEGLRPVDGPHPLTPSPKKGEGGQEGEYWTISLALKKKMTEVSRQFRKEPTLSEDILWKALRGRKLEGRKFRRQQPIGAFIVDFFCGAERLIVEVDGGIHESQREVDRQRQQLLESLGLRVVRVTSELVETNLDEALSAVRQAFGPHPRAGEGGQEADPAPLSQLGRGAGGEGIKSMEDPHPLTPSPKAGEGEQEADPAPLSQAGRGAGGEGVPRFSKIARSYLLHVGNLDWKQINPDIFGSMIQAVADEAERGALGMHYTSVPNILKVLNPLFLDDLRTQLEAAGENGRKLLNLRQRMARIRVFDPACGSGNFLVIAYKEMRAIEAEVNRRRKESERKSEIPLSNFRGIEIRHFASEIARLALVIAKYQCDVVYLGQLEARSVFLPLENDNWITHGNALRLDWLSLCPPTGTGVKLVAEDLFSTTLEQTEIDFENEGGETYICGNPPYAGATIKAPKGASKELKERLRKENESRKSDLKTIFGQHTPTWKALDYVAGWFMKAAGYSTKTRTVSAFVSTNSICQGQQVPALWPLIFKTDHHISFAHTSFKWKNLAANNAGVTVVIVGLSRQTSQKRYLYSLNRSEDTSVKEVECINAYLVPGQNVIIQKRSEPFNGLNFMTKGNAPTDGGHLLLSKGDIEGLNLTKMQYQKVVRRFLGSKDSIEGKQRFCLWLDNTDADVLVQNKAISERLNSVRKMRLESDKKQTKELSKVPFLFGEIRQRGNELPVVIPRHSSENREYLPFAMGNRGDIVADSASALYDAPLWNMAIFCSRLHLIWIATVCGKIKTDFRYSNTLGWNTFPVPTLTDQNKVDLTRCAEDILLAREHYFPATISDMYNPNRMDSEFPLVREAHDRNDEILERIYIGRRFKNDTERLEKLFEMYTKMTSQQPVLKRSTKRNTQPK